MSACLPDSEMPDDPLLDMSLAVGALSCMPAAHRVATLTLQCLQSITALKDLHTPPHQPLLTAILTAFSDPEPAPYPSPAGVSQDQVSRSSHADYPLRCYLAFGPHDTPYTCFGSMTSGAAVVQVLSMLQQTFLRIEGLSQGPDGDFDRELLVVHVLHNLSTLNRSLGGEEPSDLDGEYMPHHTFIMP